MAPTTFLNVCKVVSAGCLAVASSNSANALPKPVIYKQYCECSCARTPDAGGGSTKILVESPSGGCSALKGSSCEPINEKAGSIIACDAVVRPVHLFVLDYPGGPAVLQPNTGSN